MCVFESALTTPITTLLLRETTTTVNDTNREKARVFVFLVGYIYMYRNKILSFFLKLQSKRREKDNNNNNNNRFERRARLTRIT